ncbi:MAG TPA: radical SAM family heme chaperone HemW [Candidatus Binatia bacterium]|nr:radical SAM family heme chaperone HemW [Candidatus Binatia bacterium]
MFETFGLYIHIPYCRTKCPYCDFNVEAAATWPEARYVDALTAEIRYHASAPPFGGKRLATIFFGGGTPSLFAVASLARVLDEARRSFAADTAPEISLEATPESASVATLAGYRRAGVNRISFGIESFHPHVLKRLGRLQTAAETRHAVAMAREAGFTNVSLDLIFAVPGQSADDWRADLDTAISYAPEHVSAYNLTYEEGTPFFDLKRAGRLRPIGDEIEAAMFEEARSRLGNAGYRAYEVSNFARPGFEARHNLNYWHAGPYLGIGAGAHSHEPRGRGARRWSNERDPALYASRALRSGRAIVHEETLGPRQAAGEFVFLHLRTSEGVGEEAFRARFGLPLEETFPGTVRLLADGLLERRADRRLALSPRGLLVADSVFASFV